ncbi:hypothetical protein [Micromonospora robiginosa]|uniref:Uncharacterized protein n=1 Tax=Micromonospora robiginosa TaxID=2749844 RepID=A0A7L6B0U1_9ACTN|nr:hypothetical protein [Micromonospora ferruginea]QLQ35603.1 hypothetical protein H1D33_19755 [Micromonospora ferruginea]
MTRRSWFLVLAAGLAVALLAACGGVLWLLSAGDGEDTDCAARVAAEEAEVRTDRRWTEQDVPGIGAYPEIHWQVDYPSFACSRAPGPTDRRYQGVVRLAPADARALAAAYTWAPVTGAAPALWPALAGYVPDGVRWERSADHDAGTTEVFLDPARALLLFTAVDT